MTFFGRRGGPVRMVLALIVVGLLATLSFVIFNLNARLDNQYRANVESIDRSARIVEVNDQLTLQLQQLTSLTSNAQKAVDATAALSAPLRALGEAIGPAADLLADNTDGAQLTADQLSAIKTELDQVQQQVNILRTSAQTFGQQGTQLLSLISGLIEDLKSSVSSAQTINQMLPLPG
ncbi:hypothetical protein [Rhodococcus qingshengii]|uniref:hypothetical protein n=1 Tax=Rhodococcus qingshengii TaxID=334542 RepID=UPI00237D0751|nr:hypothetical protein [Rhodococcus qingshengii]WCT06037.1 hypothetical protein PI247_29920 [Rhodococcus qingshengii]